MIGKGTGAYSYALSREKEEGFGREGGKVKLFVKIFNKDKLYESESSRRVEYSKVYKI